MRNRIPAASLLCCLALWPAAPARADERAGVVLLPVRLRALEAKIGSAAPVPVWARQLRATMGLAFETLMEQREDMRAVAMPELTDAQSLALDENLRVVLTIIDTTQYFRSPPWKAQRTVLDRHFGDGLAFLADKAGARYALLIDGVQVVQADWAGFMRHVVPGAVASTDAYVQLALLDLGTGEVVWSDGRDTGKMKGPTGRPLTDLRDTPTARELLRQLFASYPRFPALTD